MLTLFVYNFNQMKRQQRIVHFYIELYVIVEY